MGTNYGIMGVDSDASKIIGATVKVIREKKYPVRVIDEYIKQVETAENIDAVFSITKSFIANYLNGTGRPIVENKTSDESANKTAEPNIAETITEPAVETVKPSASKEKLPTWSTAKKKSAKK
jgi:hypothetical protein